VNFHPVINQSCYVIFLTLPYLTIGFRAFKDDRFTGRPQNLQTIMTAFFASSKNGANSNGIVFSHGHMWQEQRRFALRTLRDQVKKAIRFNVLRYLGALR